MSSRHCIYFRSFRELFDDAQEPANKGVCLLNPIFQEGTIEFDVVETSHCEVCPYRLAESTQESVGTVQTIR